MKLTLNISDADYRELISKSRRMRGSIGLIDLKEATFNRHHSDGRSQARDYRFHKLPHGRVSITDKTVRLSLNIERSETNICASECIDEESRTASDFVFEQIEEEDFV
jgi:hypothetical protein